MKTTTVRFFPSPQNTIKLTCEIAKTFYEKEQGLIGKTTLGDDEGMLFAFTFSLPRCFSMKTVSFPLDIIFVRKKRIVRIFHATPNKKKMVPHLYCGVASVVIECNQGFCRQHGIDIGTRVDF